MRSHRGLLTFAVTLALLFVVAAYAQEQVGGLEGIVSDSTGVLPGVTIEATQLNGITVTAVTDEKGYYRFPRMSIGTYNVVAKLEGFAPSEANDVKITLGRNAKVDFMMSPGAFTEAIMVVAGRPQIDVKQSSTALVIGKQELELLPRGRDFTSVVSQAPGASDEAFLGGVSIDGASGSENRFIIDGVDTTHPQEGVSGQLMVTDFLEEVQVKSAGYNAEYGGSLGGVVNAVTKSGGNQFSGSVLAYYNNDGMNGDQRLSSYESNCGTAMDCLILYNKDDSSRVEPGFSLGGPLMKDRLWFFVAYQPSYLDVDRTPLGSTTSYNQKVTEKYFSGNLKGTIGTKLFYKLSANLSPEKTESALPARDGSTPADVDLGIVTKVPSESYSLYVDLVGSRNFLVSGRAGYWMEDTNQTSDFPASQFYFRNGTIPLPENDPRYRPSGFRSVPSDSFWGTEFDKWERNSAGVDATYFLNAGGSHEIKLGVQTEKIKNGVLSGEQGNNFEIRWGLADRYGAGVIGEYGSVAVRSFKTDGAAEASNQAIFLQDSWNIGTKLTVNVGVRAEKERVPNYGAAVDPSLPTYAMSWDFGDKVAPRLGFSWDTFGDSRLKIYGSWGTYYDITKLEMPRGSFGGDKWISYIYPLNTLDWETLDDGCTVSVNDPSVIPCPGLGTPAAIRDLRHPTDPADGIDPNLQPMENREIQLGADYQLRPTSVLGFRYVNKSLINTIEDIGYLVCEGTTCNEVYTTGNPGKGLVIEGYVDGPVPRQPEAIRDYQAAEFSYTHLFSDNWSLRATYTYSELTGNYSGLASSDEFGRTDPNVARYFDGLVYGFDSNGDLVDGVLNTDRPHAIELNGLYQFKFGTSVGFSQSWRSGSPISQDEQLNGVNFFPYGRENLGRTDDVTATDLYIAHPFDLGRLGLELSLNVSNLFDEKTVTRVDNAKWNADLCEAIEANNGTCDYDYYFTNVVPYDFDAYMASAGFGDAELNPTFLKPITYQAPRIIRFGVKLTF